MLCVLAACGLAACGSSRAPADGGAVTLDNTALGEAPLMPGDAIRVSFSRDSGLNGEYPIDENGTVSLPLLGARSTGGRPAAKVKEDFEAEFSERTRNQSVQVVYLRRVRILGEVRAPGLYLIDPTMNFDDAIALAGGATDSGDLRNVRLIRQGQDVVEGLDVTLSVATSVESGDQVFVPKTSWLSRNAAVLIGATISAIGLIVAFAN